ncbi:MAG: histone deacetylase family protein [Chthoniobacterales bacterium]
MERPARISEPVPRLRERHPQWEWRTPTAPNESSLKRAHSHVHLETIRRAAADFDADSPAYPEIFEHAARASGAAIDVARTALAGEKSFSLMRPPGHHATRDQAMGFCYFNHIAIAALEALAQGADRVAIWDFDAHHGNGTEAIVRGNPRIAFASVHQHPAYPGTGTESFDNIRNFPIAPESPRPRHMAAIEQSLSALLESKPDLLLVSAGFDAYAGDPITQMTLVEEDFATCGKWLREAGVPAGAILEGGCSDQLPQLIECFLAAWAE